MFVRQPQFRNSNADVQIFNSLSRNTAGSEPDSTDAQRAWNKPPGVSHVYMMLIGCGGTGDSSSGGGCGAVTVWYGAAQNVPDSLIIHIGNPFQPPMHTYVKYRNGTATYILLQANSASGAGGGSAMTANAFAASGFFQSINGVSGSSSGFSPESNTFLSGGGASANSTANYGYQNQTAPGNGYFMLQPVIVGVGALGSGRGGIGCGGGMVNGEGGPGMVLIASW